MTPLPLPPDTATAAYFAIAGGLTLLVLVGLTRLIEKGLGRFLARLGLEDNPHV